MRSKTETEKEIDKQIATDTVEYLRNNNDVCVNISHNARHPYIRFNNDEWEYAYFGKYNKIEGETLTADEVVDLISENPTEIVPLQKPKKKRHNSSSKTLWKMADEQDVFTSHDRCYWCGVSERQEIVNEYKSKEDGCVLLCNECHQTWDEQNCLISPQS